MISPLDPYKPIGRQNGSLSTSAKRRFQQTPNCTSIVTTPTKKAR